MLPSFGKSTSGRLVAGRRIIKPRGSDRSAFRVLGRVEGADLATVAVSEHFPFSPLALNVIRHAAAPDAYLDLSLPIAAVEPERHAVVEFIS
jgi:hypothetical protein